MHQDCKTCKEKRNCINGAKCMRFDFYIDRLNYKLCDEGK